MSPRRIPWVAFSLPCAVSWSYDAWVFWPAIMPPDAVGQWDQAMSGVYRDWHPAFHSLVIHLLASLWRSPGVVVLAQCAALSLVTGWIVGAFRSGGMPAWLCWSVSVGTALLPANGTFVASMLKDSAFGIAFAWLTGLLFAAVLTRGRWLDDASSGPLLALAAALVALLRHNGPPVAFASLLFLAIAYPSRGRRVALALAASVSAWLLVRGPLYASLAVEPAPSVSIQPALHQIAAHLAAGTEFSPGELAVLDRIHPLEHGKWPYDPRDVSTILFRGKLNWEALDEERPAVLRIFLGALRRNPAVSARHVLAASELVWRIARRPGTAYIPACLAVEGGRVYQSDPAQRDVAPRERDFHLKLVERPLPPFLRTAWSDRASWLVWRPALPTYLLFIGIALAALRGREWRWLLVGTPAAIQSAAMFLVAPNQDFRYQWPVFFVGMLFWPFLFHRASRGAVPGGEVSSRGASRDGARGGGGGADSA